MSDIDCLVIGAGVVGLAVARALARAGREVVVVEAEDAIGTEVSSRNSEVIHAGIYYPTGLAKTRLCVDGNAMLYRFCREYRVPHRRCGKLIVATDESEVAKLAALEDQAKANGVDDLVWLSGAEARALEPALRARRALLSPSTGIVDSHALMLALRGDAEAQGALIALATPVVSGRAQGDGVTIETGGADPMRFVATLVVNAAGLGAQAVARAIDGMPADKIPPLFLAKGNYFSLTRPLAVFPARLSDAGARRPRHPSYAGPRRAGAVRTGRRMGGDDRLQRRSAACRILLCRDPDLLAGSAGRRVAAGLRRNPPEDCSPWRVGDRFSDPDRTRPRRPRARQSVRHRVPRPDGEPRDRRRDREAALSAAQPVLAPRSYAVHGRARRGAAGPQPFFSIQSRRANSAREAARNLHQFLHGALCIPGRHIGRLSYATPFAATSSNRRFS